MGTIYDKDIERVLYTREQLEEKVRELGARITADYAGESLLLVCILKGSVVFYADLMRRIDLDVELDFMSASSYGKGAVSGGVVRIKKDLSVDIAGRHVLIVEDILDTGNTLSALMEVLRDRKPASIEICTLMDKPERRIKDLKAKYIGFTIPDEFVVGYGLDYGERYRSMDYVGILRRDVYEKA